jgi:hypothetical protein
MRGHLYRWHARPKQSKNILFLLAYTRQMGEMKRREANESKQIKGSGTSQPSS